MRSCATCGRDLPTDPPARRRFCRETSTCRRKAFDARQALRRDLAFDLLIRQTQAVQTGDRVALAAIAEAASRLLPAA